MTDENDPVQDVTRIAVITGASSGIGLAAAESLARAGDEVVLVGRDDVRLKAAAERVRDASGRTAAVFRADFAVLDEVRALAEALRSGYPRISVLANNAGGIFPRRVTTVDGFELTMQTNHLAPFLLTNLLRDRVDRVITTASAAHMSSRLDVDKLDTPGRYRSMTVYGSSKVANIMFAAESARRWPDVLSTSFHPGTVRTRFGSENAIMGWYFRAAPWLRTPDQGADTLVWLADAPAEELTNGGYYVNRAQRRPQRGGADPDLAARLWEASAAAVGL